MFAVCRFIDDEGDIDLVGEHPAALRVRRQRKGAQFDFRIQGAKFAQNHRKDGTAQHRLRKSHAQRPEVSERDTPDMAPGILDRQQDPSDIFSKSASRCGDRNPPRLAFEQFDITQFAFEIRDPARQGRLRDIQPFGCTVEVLLLCDRKEIGEMLCDTQGAQRGDLARDSGVGVHGHPFNMRCLGLPNQPQIGSGNAPI